MDSVNFLLDVDIEALLVERYPDHVQRIIQSQRTLHSSDRPPSSFSRWITAASSADATIAVRIGTNKRQKPINLHKPDMVSLVTGALNVSRQFLSDAFAKGAGLIGLRSDTGTGKDHQAILHFQKTAVRGFYSVPTTCSENATHNYIFALPLWDPR